MDSESDDETYVHSEDYLYSEYVLTFFSTPTISDDSNHETGVEDTTSEEDAEGEDDEMWQAQQWWGDIELVLKKTNRGTSPSLVSFFPITPLLLSLIELGFVEETTILGGDDYG